VVVLTRGNLKMATEFLASVNNNKPLLDAIEWGGKGVPPDVAKMAINVTERAITVFTSLAELVSWDQADDLRAMGEQLKKLQETVTDGKENLPSVPPGAG